MNCEKNISQEERAEVLDVSRQSISKWDFENEEPTKELKSNINYIHFSGNANVDRKGFIPQ